MQSVRALIMSSRFLGLMLNTSAMFVLQLSNFIIPFFSYNLISTRLGADFLGSYIFIISFLAIGVVVCDMGLSITAMHKFQKARKKNTYINSVYILKGMSVAMMFFVIPFAVNFANLRADLIIVVFISLIASSFVPIWYMQTNEKILLLVAFGLSGKALHMGLLLMSADSSSIEYYLYSHAAGVVMTCVLGVGYMCRQMRRSSEKGLSFNIRYIKKLFNFSVETFVSRVLLVAYTMGNTLIIGIIGTMQNVALYGGPEKIYQAGQGVITPVSQVLFPFLSNQPDMALFRRVFIVFFVVFISGCLFIAYYAETVLGLLFGSLDGLSVELLRLFLVVSVVNYVGIMFGFPAFALHKNLQIPNKSVTLGGICYVVLLPILLVISDFSLFAYVYCLLAIELLVCGYRIYWFFRLNRNKTA